MRDGKGFASLTSGLLARKGQARPAMRPQGYAAGLGEDDLGWNDMGHDMPRPAGARLPAGLAAAQAEPIAGVTIADVTILADATIAAVTVALPDVLRQQDALAREYAEPDAAAPPVIELIEVVDTSAPVAVPRVAGRKAAFTLRLTADRHRLLRLACAVQNRSAQQIVAEALDRMLADLPDVARLAAGLPHQD